MSRARSLSNLSLGLAELTPGWSRRSQRRRLRKMARHEPYALMREIARDVIEADDHVWVSAVFDHAEQRFVSGDDDAMTLLGFGLFEDIQNIASHRASPATADGVRAMLHPRSQAVWDEVNSFWFAVAAESETAPPITADQLERIENAELRLLVEATFRRMPDGRLVGMSDAVRHEVARGGGGHVDGIE